MCLSTLDGESVPEAARRVPEQQSRTERQEEEKDPAVRTQRRSRLQDPERG